MSRSTITTLDKKRSNMTSPVPSASTGASPNPSPVHSASLGRRRNSMQAWFGKRSSRGLPTVDWREGNGGIFYRNPKLPLFQVMCFVEGGSMEKSCGDFWGLIFFPTRPQVTLANNISAKWIADLYWTSWFKMEWIFVANFSFTLWWKWHNSHKKWLSNLGNL